MNDMPVNPEPISSTAATEAGFSETVAERMRQYPESNFFQTAPTPLRVIKEAVPKEMLKNHMPRAERRKMQRDGRKQKVVDPSHKKSYAKDLGVRVNYERVMKVRQKNNKAWDDCNEMMNATNVILHSCTGLLPFIRSEDLRPHVADQQYLARIALAMVEEVKGMYSRFKRNFERHKGLSGSAATIDDTMVAFEIYNEYLALLECYDASAAHLYSMITEQLQLAVGTYVAAVGEEVAMPVVRDLNRATHQMVVGRLKAKAVGETAQAQTEAPAEEATQDPASEQTVA